MTKKELTKINFKSAIPIAVIALVIMLLVGIWVLYNIQKVKGNLSALPPELAEQYASFIEGTNAVSLLVESPLIYAVVVLILSLIIILIYNLVAKKFPIGWELK